MSRISDILVGALLASAFLGCAFVQQTFPDLTLSDSNVVSVLDKLDESEIEAAQLAQKKASTFEVKAFAGRVLNEHRELTDANRRLATQLALQPQQPALAAQLQRTHEQAMQRLGTISGTAFDRAYVEYEIQQHVRIFNFIEAAAESEGTPQLKQELVRSGPDLLSHISAARALARHLDSEGQETVAVREGARSP